jgi:hypothetical protein
MQVFGYFFQFVCVIWVVVSSSGNFEQCRIMVEDDEELLLMLQFYGIVVGNLCN